MKFFNHPEGYVEPDGSSWKYVYQCKDHLGNVRLSYADDGDFETITSNDFSSNYGAWQSLDSNHPYGNMELLNGQLKVGAGIAFSGVRTLLGDNFVNGDEITFQFDIDKGTTDKIQVYFHEKDANDNHVAYNFMFSEAINGSHTFTHTIGSGSKLYVTVRKSSTSNDVGQLTHFFLDNVFATTGELEIREENNYYPFGLKHKGYNDNVSAFNNGVASKWKYNGIELEESLGLDLYEMELRQYDPAIARWTAIDPVTHHSMSTYMAFDGNPVYWADPSGADSESFFQSNFLNANGGHWTDSFRGDNSNGSDNNSEKSSSGCPPEDPNCNGGPPPVYSYDSNLPGAGFGTSNTESSSDENEPTSVEILIWTKGKGLDVGHTAIRIDGITYGYYPEDFEEAARLNDTNGFMRIMNNDYFEIAYIGDEITSFEIAITSNQKQKLLRELNRIDQNPGQYNLRGNQCTSVATGCMNRAGIYIKSSSLFTEKTGKFYSPAALSAELTKFNIGGSNPIVINKRKFTVGE